MHACKQIVDDTLACVNYVCAAQLVSIAGLLSPTSPVAIACFFVLLVLMKKQRGYGLVWLNVSYAPDGLESHNIEPQYRLW